MFYEIDHERLCEDCQKTMRLSQEGKLSTHVYYCDDPTSKLSELPEPIQELESTHVQVREGMVTIGFLNSDGRQ